MLVIDLSENQLKFANSTIVKNIVNFFVYCSFLFLRSATCTIIEIIFLPSIIAYNNLLLRIYSKSVVKNVVNATFLSLLFFFFFVVFHLIKNIILFIGSYLGLIKLKFGSFLYLGPQTNTSITFSVKPALNVYLGVYISKTLILITYKYIYMS